MPADTKELQGASAFLNRMDATLRGVDPDAPKPAEPAEPRVPSPATNVDDGLELDDLEPNEIPKAPKTGDPLDSLDDDEPAVKPPAAAAAEPKPAATPSGDDPLASYTPEQREAINALIDDRVAKELTETPSAAGVFKRLKAEVRELQSKVAGSAGDPERAAALEAATSRIAELEEAERIREQASSVLRLEDTKAYKEAVVEPQRKILAASDAIADRYGADKDELANLLSTTDRRALSDGINKLLGEDVVDADKFELYELSRNAQATFARKRELADNAEVALKEAEELAAQEQSKAALVARQSRESAAKAQIERLTTKARIIVDTVGKDIMDAAAKDIADRGASELSEADLAFARVSAKALVPLAKRIMALENELAAANDELVARRKASPGARAGAPASSDGEAVARPTGSFADRVGQAIAEKVGG